MSMIKHYLGFLAESVRRAFNRTRARMLFFNKSGSLRKPYHSCGMKYWNVGKKVDIDSYSRIDCYESGTGVPFLLLGDHVKIGSFCTILCSTRLVIENNVRFADHVFITTENHGTNPEKGDYILQELVSKNVFIGEHCWIGEKVIILPGVSIGRWSIVGAGSVVTKDIPEYCIAVGNPAKVIKKYDKEKHCWVKI